MKTDQLPIEMATSFCTFMLLRHWKPLRDWIETLLSGLFWAETYRRVSSQTNPVSPDKKNRHVIPVCCRNTSVLTKKQFTFRTSKRAQ